MKLRTALAALVLAAAAPASGTDLHAYWDQRCQSCHGHAGAFARRFLGVREGRLIGVHHRSDLDRFLRQHYLTDELVEPVTAMLAAQVTTPPLYAQRCAGCHGNAAELARRSLQLRDGAPVVRADGRPVAELLARGHGKVSPEEARLISGSLARVLREVGADASR